MSISDTFNYYFGTPSRIDQWTPEVKSQAEARHNKISTELNKARVVSLAAAFVFTCVAVYASVRTPGGILARVVGGAALFMVLMDQIFKKTIKANALNARGYKEAPAKEVLPEEIPLPKTPDRPAPIRQSASPVQKETKSPSPLAAVASPARTTAPATDLIAFLPTTSDARVDVTGVSEHNVVEEEPYLQRDLDALPTDEKGDTASSVSTPKKEGASVEGSPLEWEKDTPNGSDGTPDLKARIKPPARNPNHF